MNAEMEEELRSHVSAFVPTIFERFRPFPRAEAERRRAHRVLAAMCATKEESREAAGGTLIESFLAGSALRCPDVCAKSPGFYWCSGRDAGHGPSAQNARGVLSCTEWIDPAAIEMCPHAEESFYLTERGSDQGLEISRIPTILNLAAIRNRSFVWPGGFINIFSGGGWNTGKEIRPAPGFMKVSGQLL